MVTLYENRRKYKHVGKRYNNKSSYFMVIVIWNQFGLLLLGSS